MDWEAVTYTIRVKTDPDTDAPTRSVEAFCEELLNRDTVLGVEATEERPMVTEFDFVD